MPGRRHGCRKSRSWWISCPNCQISSAPGCCSPCARPHALVMLCGQSRQQWLPHMPKCMTMLFGTPWTLSLAGSRRMRQQVREPWLSSQHRSGASDWFPPIERRRLLTGRGGLTLCQSSASASQPSLSPACADSLAEGGRQSASLEPAAAARALLQDEGWHACPEWRAVLEGAISPRMRDTSLGDWPHGWQSHASRIRNLHFHERVFLPTLPPIASALVRSQAGPHAGAWLTPVPIDPATTLQPHAMQLALRRRLRLPLHLSSRRCGPSPGCGAQVDAFGDHALACAITGLLARRAKILERTWVRVAREAVGADGQVVPQQWLAHTTAPNVVPADRRRLDLVIYGATPLGGAPCCYATLVSPLTRTGQPQPCAAQRRQTAQRSQDGRATQARRVPRAQHGRRAAAGGPGHRGRGRWNEGALRLVLDLVRVRAQRAGPALRTAANAAWSRRWWSQLAVSVQQAVAATALGNTSLVPACASQEHGPEFDQVLNLAESSGPSRLPLR